MKTRRLFSVDSDAAFNVAAKHLFRHLHEARVLRKNPLVAHLFKDPTIGGLGKERERTVLDRIHGMVHRGSEYCRAVDLANGNDERALRQYAIIKLNCLDRQPLRDVAATVGISFGYCYSERAKICRRVARHLFSGALANVIPDLPRSEKSERSASPIVPDLSDCDAQAAFRQCEGMVSAPPSVIHRIEALRAAGFLSLRLGIAGPAIEAHTAARVLLREILAADPSPSTRDVMKASVALFESKLAYYRGDAAQALTFAKQAVEALQPYQQSSSMFVRELHIESLDELGAALCNVGHWQRGYDSIAEAERKLSCARMGSPQLRARVRLNAWRLRNLMPTESRIWHSSDQRLKALTNVFEEAYAVGAFYEATGALATLTEYHAFVGNYAQMLQMARSAVLMANQQAGDRIRVQTALVVATALFSTNHWEYASKLLPTSAELCSCEAYYKRLISYAVAQRALRLGNPDDAFSVASRQWDRKQFTTLTTRRQLTAALAAHKLEQKQVAQSIIEETVCDAERLGIAPLLRDAYAAAATLKRDIRYKRRAQEIARAITA